jgi:hypothetical protein
MRLVAFITVLLMGCSLVAARPPDPCSLTSTVTDAKLTLSISDGRRSFREGEIIPLVLSFTSTVENRYRAAVRYYDRSGRLNIDTYCLSPEARDPLADYFAGKAFMGGGLGGETQLSEKPFTATSELNEWIQPGPGHYRLWVVSGRVFRPRDASEAPPDFRGVTLRSNTIEIEVIKADAPSLAKQLQEATATYENASAGEQKEAARRLRFLNTKQSAETLARLFWSLNDQPGGWDLKFGLWGSPYRAEIIAAMQREISSPDHPITQDFLQLFTQLQIAGEAPGDPTASGLVGLQKWQESRQRMEAHERELKKVAITATVAALPQKTGRARALTALTLATESADMLDKETASQMRRQLIALWADLPEKTRQDLIQDVLPRWGNEVPALAGPEALPILLDFVSQPATHHGNDAISRNAALKRIFDLDPVKGRSLILRDLSDPNAQPSISLVKLLPPEELQPAVQQAVQRIVTAQQRTAPFEHFDARPLDFSLLEAFGDKSALESLEANFKVNDDRLPKGFCVGYVAEMLRYFLRVDPMFGAREVQAALDRRNDVRCYPRLLEDLGSSLPKVEQLAISALDDPDPEVSASAARALGRWGTAKAELALWARLKRFHEQWHDREGELRITPDLTTPIARATLLERALLESIVIGTNWICGPEKFNQLRALTSRQNWSQLSAWTEQWEDNQPWLLSPYWGPEDQLSFSVLQYSNLDEEQIRLKLSQLPKGSKLYFVTYAADQMSNPVSMGKQQAVLQRLRKYAAQFGVTVEERPRYGGAA